MSDPTLSDQTMRLERQWDDMSRKERNESQLAAWEGIELSKRVDALDARLRALELPPAVATSQPPTPAEIRPLERRGETAERPPTRTDEGERASKIATKGREVEVLKNACQGHNDREMARLLAEAEARIQAAEREVEFERGRFSNLDADMLVVMRQVSQLKGQLGAMERGNQRLSNENRELRAGLDTKFSNLLRKERKKTQGLIATVRAIIDATDHAEHGLSLVDHVRAIVARAGQASVALSSTARRIAEPERTLIDKALNYAWYCLKARTWRKGSLEEELLTAALAVSPSLSPIDRTASCPPEPRKSTGEDAPGRSWTMHAWMHPPDGESVSACMACGLKRDDPKASGPCSHSRTAHPIDPAWTVSARCTAITNGTPYVELGDGSRWYARPGTSQWVSVGERLPEPRTNVLAYRPRDLCIYTAWFDEVTRTWSHFGTGARELCGVTHWRPLPPPPAAG